MRPEQLTPEQPAEREQPDAAEAPLCANPVQQAARRPQQERGQRRVDAILDAAAQIIAEEGTAGVKLHRIAQRTCTTTGSMYHFFPDREALLRALLERHTHQLRAQMEQLERKVVPEWAELSTPELVDRFLEPFLNYIDRHPDFLRLTRLVRISDISVDRDAELDQSVVRLNEAFVALRHPQATAPERKMCALAITAMAEGVVALIARTADAEDATLLRRELRRELRCALVAYLDSYTPRSG